MPQFYRMRLLFGPDIPEGILHVPYQNLKQNLLIYRVFLTVGEIFLKICLEQKNNRVVKMVKFQSDNYTKGEILKISWELRQAFRFYLPRKFKIQYFS